MNEDPGYMDNLIDSAAPAQEDTVEIEMALLSLCMRKDKAMLEAVESRLVKEDFSDPRNVLIFGTIVDMFLSNSSIDRFTVTNELERKGELEHAGGLRYIYKVGETTAVSSSIQSYISAIREKSDKSKLLKEIGDYTEDGLNAALDKVISARHADMKEVNLKAIKLGAEY